jgi:ankyrin repeat protein
VWDNKIDRIAQLLEDGANPNCIGSTEGATPLLLAVQERHVNLIPLLVEAGADINMGSIRRSGASHDANSRLAPTTKDRSGAQAGASPDKPATVATGMGADCLPSTHVTRR